MGPAGTAIASILSRALPPAELARQAEELAGHPDAHLLLPEVLNALGVMAEEDPASPLTFDLLSLARRLARPGSDTCRVVREAIEVGWLFPLAAEMTELLRQAGADLSALLAEAESLACSASESERRRGLSLMCALGSVQWRTLLEAETGRSGRLEEQRAQALAREEALPELTAALDDPRVAVRMRAEAALLALGPLALPAAAALLHMPPWPGGDERPSPVLRLLGEPARPAIEAALASEGVARRRAEALLTPPPSAPAPEETPIDHLTALATGPLSGRQRAFEAVFASWFASRLPRGLRQRLIEATLDRLSRLGWLPTGPLEVQASPVGLRRGAAALCWLCLRIEPELILAACRVLKLVRWPAPVPLLDRLLATLANHHVQEVAQAATSCLRQYPQE
jgi:hypothetical protein